MQLWIKQRFILILFLYKIRQMMNGKNSFPLMYTMLHQKEPKDPLQASLNIPKKSGPTTVPFVEYFIQK
jgi:hypothetical protein